MHRMLAALLAVMLAAPAWADDAVSLRLNWYMGGVHAPFFLGKERGYYREAGLDLTVNEGRALPTPRRSLPPAPIPLAWPTYRP